jgi:hypothetical protein
MGYNEPAGALVRLFLNLHGAGLDLRATLVNIFEEHCFALFADDRFDGILQSLSFELSTKRSTHRTFGKILLSEGAL